MNRRQLLITAAAAAFSPRIAYAHQGAAVESVAPPVTEIRPHRIEQLGRVRIDNYAWLRDPNWAEVSRDTSKMQPDIRAHLDDENRYADAVLAPTQTKQLAFAEAMAAMAVGDIQAPATRDGPWEYYLYVRPGEDHTVHARRPVGGGDEQVLLDEQARSQGQAYYRILQAQPSPDHSLFIWAEDNEGGDRHRLCVHDLTTGQITVSDNADAYGWEGLTVSSDSQWLFWVWRDPRSRPAKVFRRPVRGGEDVLVYHEQDSALFMSVGRMASRSHLFIRIQGPDLDEWRLIPAADPTADPMVVEPRQVGLHYQVESWNGDLVILTDADDAIDGRLMRTSPDAPGRAHWRDWVPYVAGTHLLEMHPFESHFVRLQRRDGRLELVVSPKDGGADRLIVFDEAAYALVVAPGQAFDSAALRVILSSPRLPRQWIDCDLSDGQRTVVQTQTVGGGFDPANYEVRRLGAPASDGQVVPVTVLMKRGVVLDGSAPLLMYGYGAYGVNSEAEFSVPNLALVDQGWIYAIAHVRGGSEKGRSWFLDGRRFKKRNSFTDFNACAEHLIDGGYGSAGRVVAYGLSAGGLLVGGALNLRPDLYGAAIAQVPFVDMLNTMSDADHPLVPAFRPDWGDPLADPEAYDYIASISPYENVTAQAYPPILATAGIRDDRVSYWEPGKWVANLRAHSTSGAPVLFRIDMAAGHQSASGLSDQFRQMGLFWAFADYSLNALNRAS